MNPDFTIYQCNNVKVSFLLMFYHFLISYWYKSDDRYGLIIVILYFKIVMCTGNEPVEEDIDIVGGNDPPLSSYPPVEIDVTNKDSKSSSSSSSSSDSGSSSSGLCYCTILKRFPASPYVVSILIFAACTHVFSSLLFIVEHDFFLLSSSKFRKILQPSNYYLPICSHPALFHLID